MGGVQPPVPPVMPPIILAIVIFMQNLLPY